MITYSDFISLLAERAYTNNPPGATSILNTQKWVSNKILQSTEPGFFEKNVSLALADLAQ